MSIKRTIRQRDFIAGAFFFLTGIAVTAVSSNYPLGTAMRMGPGYFPALLGGVLTLLGLAIGFKAFRSARPLTDLSLEPLTLRPALMVSAGILLFAAAIQSAGLALSTIGLVFVSGFAHRQFRWNQLALSALGLTVAAVGIFAYGLQLPFRVLPF
jgi:hypothetical protein